MFLSSPTNSAVPSCNQVAFTYFQDEALSVPFVSSSLFPAMFYT